jgi:murein L,D-transpeptidase YcbB/YkuD
MNQPGAYMSNYSRFLITCLVIFPITFISTTVSAETKFSDEILKRESMLLKNKTASVGKTRLHGARFIYKLYKLSEYQPLWNQKNSKALLTSIENISMDGLTPNDYLKDSITPLVTSYDSGKLSVNQQADRDLLLSEAFVRAVYNLLVGKVDPESLDSDFNFSQTLAGGKSAPMLLEKIKSSQIEQAFDWARPKLPRYQWLKDGLAKYRSIQAAGGWEPIPNGKTLKPGDSDPRVAQLRKRLSITGDYQGKVEDSPLFDDKLARAVERFQTRHGMDVDGAVGKKTLVELNTPVDERIDQIRVALERQRWYLHEAMGEFIVVDIAGFKAYWVKDDKIIWEEIVQVGKKYTNTPVFKDKIRYLEFNPTWTIPAGIMRRSILPKLKKDSDYLDKKGFLLLTQEGKQIDPKTIDWASIDRMPYIVRQPPGEDNALGLVKFMFPNKHAVYLHDTNHKELFDRTQRTFSSGCVRVDNPFDLAERLLAGQDDWNREKIDQVIASGKTTRVNLDKPIRIIITYNTAYADQDLVHFKEDIYKRNPAVLKGLNGKFKIRKPDG